MDINHTFLVDVGYTFLFRGRVNESDCSRQAYLYFLIYVSIGPYWGGELWYSLVRSLWDGMVKWQSAGRGRAEKGAL
jgi:hypothetical protein